MATSTSASPVTSTIRLLMATKLHGDYLPAAQILCDTPLNHFEGTAHLEHPLWNQFWNLLPSAE